MDTSVAKIQNATGEARFVFDAIVGGENFFQVAQEFAREFPSSNFDVACAGAASCLEGTAAALDEQDVMRGFLVESLRNVYRLAMIGSEEKGSDYSAAIRALSEIAKLAGLK